MGEIVRKRDTGAQCWAQLRLENGDRILISVAEPGVQIFKLKWGGLIPGAKLWASDNLVQLGRVFFDPPRPSKRPLDCIIDALINCRSAAEVCSRIHDLDARIA